MPRGNRERRRTTTPDDDEKLEREWKSVNRHRGYLGPSIIELMWQELDRLVTSLMEDDYADGERELVKAQALGVAYCIALLQNPYTARLARDDAVEAVRQRAMARYRGEEES